MLFCHFGAIIPQFGRKKWTEKEEDACGEKKLQCAFPLIHIVDGKKRREEFPVKQRNRKEVATLIITEISENCVIDNFFL